MADELTAILAAIRERQALASDTSLRFARMDERRDAIIRVAYEDSPLLLAAVEAVLGLHVMQEKPVRSYEHCPAHAFNPETRRFGSFEDVRACPDCSYTEYYVCSHCDCPNDRWPCPTYEAIRAALTGKEAGDA